MSGQRVCVQRSARRSVRSGRESQHCRHEAQTPTLCPQLSGHCDSDSVAIPPTNEPTKIPTPRDASSTRSRRLVTSSFAILLYFLFSPFTCISRKTSPALCFPTFAGCGHFFCHWSVIATTPCSLLLFCTMRTPALAGARRQLIHGRFEPSARVREWVRVCKWYERASLAKVDERAA